MTYSRAEKGKKIFPREKGISAEFYFRFQLILDCMKTRTDDLSKMTVQVLKHYSKNDVNEFDEGEMRFYEKYVKPIKKHL